MAAIRRLLIANRGEIAVRVICACREMDIEAVVAATPGEREAMHAELADGVVVVGSYLDAATLVAAAVENGCDAVHPGYGFLSENADFAEKVIGAGVVWVGPPPDAMRRLGDKVAARHLAEVAGVPVVAGFTGDDLHGRRPHDALTDEALIAAAADLGPPLIVKAAAGGGGRGMREVHDLADLPEALTAARAEAAKAFGDDAVFLERFLTGARHIEVQVVLDDHGGAVHLGERDCSLQRRHQKIVEESPSPAVDPDLRARLGAAALAVAREAGYRGAGTAEFLLLDDGSWAFLEMNARLQVEHPVTEAVAGIDLVRAQLTIAAGDPLPWTQEDVHLAGHAIEARVYAEDPGAGFLPATGTVDLLDLPRWPGVRIDTALRQGDRVGLGFDPLLAKVIAFAEHRPACLARLRAALAETRIVGVTTNLGFLIDALGHPDVVAGRTGIDWVETVWHAEPPPLPEGVHALGDPTDPWFAYGPAEQPPGVTVAGRHALYRGWSYAISDDERGAVTLAPAGGSLAAPMPASVERVDVAEGDRVHAGQIALVLEAMKMYLPVTVPVDGVVRAVHVRPGDVVAAGQILIEVEE